MAASSERSDQGWQVNSDLRRVRHRLARRLRRRDRRPCAAGAARLSEPIQTRSAGFRLWKQECGDQSPHLEAAKSARVRFQSTWNQDGSASWLAGDFHLSAKFRGGNEIDGALPLPGDRPSGRALSSAVVSTATDHRIVPWQKSLVQGSVRAIQHRPRRCTMRWQPSRKRLGRVSA